MSFLNTFLRSVVTWWSAPTPRRMRPLRTLDARTLADIGIDASEIDSVEAEARGDSAATRRRIVQLCHR